MRPLAAASRIASGGGRPTGQALDGLAVVVAEGGEDGVELLVGRRPQRPIEQSERLQAGLHLVHGRRRYRSASAGSPRRGRRAIGAGQRAAVGRLAPMAGVVADGSALRSTQQGPEAHRPETLPLPARLVWTGDAGPRIPLGQRRDAPGGPMVEPSRQIFGAPAVALARVVPGRGSRPRRRPADAAQPGASPGWWGRLSTAQVGSVSRRTSIWARIVPNGFPGADSPGSGTQRAQEAGSGRHPDAKSQISRPGRRAASLSAGGP